MYKKTYVAERQSLVFPSFNDMLESASCYEYVLTEHDSLLPAHNICAFSDGE